MGLTIYVNESPHGTQDSCCVGGENDMSKKVESLDMFLGYVQDVDISDPDRSHNRFRILALSQFKNSYEF